MNSSQQKVDYAEIYAGEEGARIGSAGASYNTCAPKISLFATSPIQITNEYKTLIFKERTIFLINLFVLVVFGPLVFRYALGANQYVWAAGITRVEWMILIVIFLDTLNSIFRGLPMVSGKPTEVEATRSVCVHGQVVIGNCSPFVSEDEAIFLRALIGKTCTVFNTCAGRHSLHGLYVDTILNEKRLKGEESRKHMWLAWMTFVSAMVELCLRIKQREYTNDHMLAQQEQHEIAEQDITHKDDDRDTRLSKDYGVGKFDDHHHTNIRISKMEGMSTTTGEVETKHFRNLGMLTRAHSAKSGNSTEVFSLEMEGASSVPMHSIQSTLASSTRTRSLPPSMALGTLSECFDEDANTVSTTTTGASPRMSSTKKPSGDDDDDSYATETNPLRSGIDDEHINGAASLPGNDDCKGLSSSIPQSIREEFLVDVADIIPLLSFLHHWLSVLKEREWTYDYRNTPSALDSIFLAAPFLEIFDAEDIVEVHSLMVNLYDVFTGPPVPDPPDPKLPVNGDDMLELRWTFKRNDLPDWNIHWQYFSRARLRPLSCDEFRDPPGPPTEFVTTRIKPGAIVFQTLESRPSAPGDMMDRYLETRRCPYKVTSVSGDKVTVTAFPLPPNATEKVNVKGPKLPIGHFRLLEQNRGKAGAMNAYADILRVKALQWIIENDLNRPPQILLGIVDARHMLAEPSIFFNDALPYFSVDAHTKQPLKKFGEHQQDSPLCMLVQYPQYFTNVNHEDFLDNKNAAYYTLWQALRDAGKVCTSSGSNAIWEISNPSFEFATTSRIEDTGTSHKYLSKSTTVSMPCFVAYGIAKKTEDYLEAVYRWSTGAVELFWGTVWSEQIGHFLVVAIIGVLLGLACFHSTAGYYWLWLVICTFVGLVVSCGQHMCIVHTFFTCLMRILNICRQQWNNTLATNHSAL